jgi:hypothetical protein
MVPVVEGVVVAASNAAFLRDAWTEMQSSRLETQAKEREERVLARWASLVKRVLVRVKIKEQGYG